MLKMKLIVEKINNIRNKKNYLLFKMLLNR